MTTKAKPKRTKRSPAVKSEDAKRKAIKGSDKPKSKTLAIVDDGRPQDRQLADAVASPTVRNAETLVNFSAQMGDVSLTDMVDSLRDSAARMVAGDMSEAETLLATQALALNAIFSELSRRAALNMGEYMDATEMYLKLALRAQSQSRATIETLSAIKNPPVVFAKQANIAHGHQQVNNSTAQDMPEQDTRTRGNEKPQSKLLRAIK